MEQNKKDEALEQGVEATELLCNALKQIDAIRNQPSSGPNREQLRLDRLLWLLCAVNAASSFILCVLLWFALYWICVLGGLSTEQWWELYEYAAPSAVISLATLLVIKRVAR